jgi:hypothetical protein
LSLPKIKSPPKALRGRLGFEKFNSPVKLAEAASTSKAPLPPVPALPSIEPPPKVKDDATEESAESEPDVEDAEDTTVKRPIEEEVDPPPPNIVVFSSDSFFRMDKDSGLKKFTGGFGEEDTIGTFLEDFDIYRVAQGIEATKAPAVLAMFLRGAAREFYKGLDAPTKADLELLKTALIDEFNTYQNKLHASECLHLRAQKPNESIRDYAASLSKLARSAYPSGAQSDITITGRDQLALNVFINNVRKDLAPCFLTSIPNSLKEAVASAEVYEQRRENQQKRYPQQNQGASNAYSLEQIQNNAGNQRLEYILSQVHNGIKDLKVDQTKTNSSMQPQTSEPNYPNQRNRDNDSGRNRWDNNRSRGNDYNRSGGQRRNFDERPPRNDRYSYQDQQQRPQRQEGQGNSYRGNSNRPNYRRNFQGRGNGRGYGPQNSQWAQGMNQQRQTYTPTGRVGTCFSCGQAGHFSPQCPNVPMGQTYADPRFAPIVPQMAMMPAQPAPIPYPAPAQPQRNRYEANAVMSNPSEEMREKEATSATVAGLVRDGESFLQRKKVQWQDEAIELLRDSIQGFNRQP